MKKYVNRVLFERNPAASILLVLGSLLLVVIACGSKTPPPAQYVGVWTSGDGSTITIYSDGSGDYKSGNSSVSGGSVVVDEAAKTLKISLAGLGPTFKVEKAPDGGQMTLDGIVFKKSGGGSTSSDSKSDSKSSSSKAEVPSSDKLQTLVKTTFLDFSDAVQSEDFTDFHKKVAKVWQEQSSPDEMADAFKAFVDNKANYNFKKAVSPLDATFTPAPSIEQVSGMDALVVKGYYPTTPLRANFELKYTMEDGNWKLIGINIKTKSE